MLPYPNASAIADRAWMIAQNGAAIPVMYHPYFRKGSFVDAALFLYAYTDLPEMTQFADRYLAYALAHFSNDTQSVREAVERADQHHSAGDWCPSEAVYRAIVDSIVQRYDSHMIQPETGISIEDDPHFFDWTAAKRELDQRFLRARYGGEYNTRPGVREMWFRVSSVGVWWHPIIRRFVEEHQDAISDVTVERDRESDGEDTPRYYRDTDGAPYLHMPTAQFLASVPDKAAP